MALIGNSFTGYVTDQIKVRQEALGEGLGHNQDLKKHSTQHAFNSSTPWMRLSSAVSITEGTDDTPGKSVYQQIQDNGLLNGIPLSKIRGTGLAQNFVLQGAPNSVNGNKSPSGVVSQGSDVFSKAYGWGYNSNGILNGQGYVPPPGVTNVDFEYKNDGALAFASVKIKAFSAEQFALIDILYMRPGYTCLLEFGHSLYLDNNGNLINTDTSITAPLNYLFQDFTGKTTKPASYGEMSKILASEKDKWSGNYEGFFGRITKFDWKFNSDGSYDITVKLTGLGDVISSLKTNISKQTLKPVSVSSDFEGKIIRESESDSAIEEKSFIISDAYASQLNYELYSIFADKQTFKDTKEVGGWSWVPFAPTIIGNTNLNAKSYPLTLTNIPIKGTRKTWITPQGVVKFDVNDWGGTKYSPITLIKFGAFLSILQKVCNVTDGGENNLLEFEMVDDISTDALNFLEYGKLDKIENDTYIVSFPGNFSSNPNVCLIKQSPSINSNKIWPHGDLVDIPTDNVINNVLSNSYSQLNSPNDPIKNLNNPKLAYQLSEVYVNINHIATVLNGLKGGDDEAESELDVSILDLLQGILSGINTSLGGLNNFRVIFNEDTSQIQILSENPILSSTTTPENPLSIINTFGFERGTINQGSFCTSFNLNSELTDQMATQITIGSQANSNTLAGSSLQFASYSKGLLDTLMVEKESELLNEKPTNQSTASIVDPIVELWEKSEGEKSFDQVYNDREFADENFISTLNNINSNMSSLILGRLTQKKESTSPAFLPFNMSLEIHGLGGIKIYDAFKITGRGLPLSYNPNDIKLIVKSLSHTVSLDGWKTKISTLSQPIFNLDLTPGSPVIKTTGSSVRKSSNYTGEELNYDPAPIINPTHIGSSKPNQTPVFKSRKLNLRNITSPREIESLASRGKLTLIGDATTNTNFTKGSSSLKSVKLLNNKYYLDPKAAQQFKKWTSEMNTTGIPWRLTSAVRFGGNTGGGAHGYGVAVDFGNLWQVVKGSHYPQTNLPGRKTKIYESIATIGAKYGWYNPWRLSDVAGTYDEIWHFEYWGPA
jgi:hypothetical protein